MTELLRGSPSNPPPAAPTPTAPTAPAGYLPSDVGPSTDHDQARWDAEEALAAAEAAEAAAARKVAIAELLLDEVDPSARPSARAAAQDRLESAAAAHTAAETRTRRARDALQAAKDQAAAAEDDLTARLAYPNADAWLRGWLLPNWRRPIQQHWCPKWWLHAEAVSRIEALWRAWEYLRGDGALGPSMWWRDHADYHLAVLTSSTGPLARCHYRRGIHQPEDVLPTVVNPLNLADFIVTDKSGSQIGLSDV